MYHVLQMYTEERIELSAPECLLPCCLKPLLCVWDAVNAITRRVVNQDSSVGIVTRYGLIGRRIESRWGRNFPPVQTGPGAHPASYRMGTGSFPGVKRSGRGVDHPPHLAPRLKKE